MENPELLANTLFNSYTPKDIRKPIKPTRVNAILEYGINKINDKKIEIINLGGHSPESIGVITPEKACYLGDSIFSEDTKYSYFCIGIQKHSNTIELFKTADNLGAKYLLAKDVILLT